MRVRLHLADSALECRVQQRLAFHLNDLEAHLERLEIFVGRPIERHGAALHFCRVVGHVRQAHLFDLCEQQAHLDLALTRAFERSARLCRRRHNALRFRA